MANVYFTRLVILMLKTKNRIGIRSLNEFSNFQFQDKFECDEPMRAKRRYICRSRSMHDDGDFNDCQFSDQEFDDNDKIVSIDSQTDGMSHNEFNDIIDSQLNSKDNDDDDDD